MHVFRDPYLSINFPITIPDNAYPIPKGMKAKRQFDNIYESELFLYSF